MMRGRIAALLATVLLAAAPATRCTAADAAAPLWAHVRTAADFADVRETEVERMTSDSPCLVLNVTRAVPYAWATVPAPADGWDLARRAAVEASITNAGSLQAEVQLWVVAARGWESVADVATLSPGETRTFVCPLRETFPDGTPKLDPARVAGTRVIVRNARPGMVIRVADPVATGTAPPWERPTGRMEVPPVEEGPPAAGRRVRLRLPGDASADVACLLHLPDDWRPDASHPVIIEYPGNIFYTKACYSTGWPEQCAIGYGMSRGRGAIWVSLPFVDRTAGAVVENGWGDPDATAEYCMRAIEHVCASFGGDRRAVVLTGFSRGAIACGFIGLRNDRIAPFWKAFHLCQHYDGDGWNGSTLPDALERARRFRGVAVFHTDNPEDTVRPLTEAMGVPTEFAASGLGSHSTAMFLDDRPSTRRLRAWFAGVASPAPAASGGVVKVFVLAGQSNMVGQAPNELYEHQARAQETRALFAHLRKDDAWIVRDDVWITFRERKGPLTIGFGSENRTGPELEFGFRVGDHCAEPVVLVKTAWGGKSLVRDFRPPSAGLPPDDVLAKELEDRQKLVSAKNAKQGTQDPLPTLDELKAEYGAFYRTMIADVKDVMANLGREFPNLAGKRPELAGFVWFQGWNDQYGGQDSYGVNLRHLLRDVRRDLDAPGLPVVVAAMGQNGSKPAAGAMLAIQTAQLSLNDDPEFRAHARAFRTDVLVDKAAEELYPNWRKDLDAWRKVGGDHGYHYLGSALWFNRIGRAMGDAMVELLGRRSDAP